MPTSKISLYFLGTDAFASTNLKRLLGDERFEVLGVVVPPDKRVGRKQELKPCVVKVLAMEMGLEVLHAPEELLGREMDFLVVVSYGVILGDEILGLPKVAALNVHGSLLPKYRGASPIASVILNGDEVTGVSVMKVVKKMDAGPVYAVTEVAIDPKDTEPILRARMAEVGAELLAQVMPGIVNGSVEPQEQDESKVTHSGKIDRNSGRINWGNETATQIERKMRAYDPWPGIFTEFKGKRLKILKGHAKEGKTEKIGIINEVEGEIGIGTKEGFLICEELQLEGKKALLVNDFIRGQDDFVGASLE